MTASWFDTRTSVKGWLLVLAGLVATVSIYLAYGRAGIQVDGPVVRQETNWFRGPGGMDARLSGPLEYVDGCVLLAGYPVVWPETVSWDDEKELLMVRGDPVPWTGVQEVTLTGSGGVTDDFAETAERWGDADLTPESAPCHFEAGVEVLLFNADAELEVTKPTG